MERQILGRTRNDKLVYLDTEESHAATHIAEKPDLLELVKEVIPSVDASGDNVYLDRDVGRFVGYSDLVETKDGDKILYAKRRNRSNYTRFVLNREPEPTSKVTIVLRRNDSDSYELLSAWLGSITPQFPGDEYESPQSRPFWKRHALVWDERSIQAGTETHGWPWN